MGITVSIDKLRISVAWVENKYKKNKYNRCPFDELIDMSDRVCISCPRCVSDSKIRRL